MIRRLFLAFAACVLLGCAASAVRPSLDAAQAVRIADAKARTRYELAQYERPLVAYVPAEKLWWVNYRRLNAKYTTFSIRIDDKTKKPTLVLP